MPTLDVSELNIVISVLGTPTALICQKRVTDQIQGAFTILYGLISVKIKQKWYLGEALPALLIGIILGPLAAKFLDSTRWGHAIKDQTEYITLVHTVTHCATLIHS